VESAVVGCEAAEGFGVLGYMLDYVSGVVARDCLPCRYVYRESQVVGCD
jgi:hypothetical protein